MHPPRIARITTFLLLALTLMPDAAGGARIALLGRDDIGLYQAFATHYQRLLAERIPTTDTVRPFMLNRFAGPQEAWQQLRAFRPTIIVTIGSSALELALAQAGTLPLIYTMVINPTALAPDDRPLLHGISVQPPLTQKLLLLRQLCPTARSIGLVYSDPAARQQADAARAAADGLGFALVSVPVRSPAAAIKSFDRIMPTVDAYLLLFDRAVLNPTAMEALLRASFRARVPIIGLSQKYVHMGALYSLDLEVSEMAQQAVQATLQCAVTPRQCTETQITEARGTLYINTTIARKMGLPIPAQLRATAVLIGK